MQFGCLSVSRSVACDVEELLAQRGIVVTSETVRECVFARLAKPTPMNCVVAVLGVVTNGMQDVRLSHASMGRPIPCGERSIKTEMCWIYGSQSRRDKHAAKRFFRKLRVWASRHPTRDHYR